MLGEWAGRVSCTLKLKGSVRGFLELLSKFPPSLPADEPSFKGSQLRDLGGERRVPSDNECHEILPLSQKSLRFPTPSYVIPSPWCIPELLD